MYEVDEGGIAVPGELYELPDEVWARVEAGEPPGLYRGPVELEDGRVVPGILYPQGDGRGDPPRHQLVRRLAGVLVRPRGWAGQGRATGGSASRAPPR